jgi:ABC-2 type transport system permease protein/lipopolysaccharide transport system permease protein
LVPNAFEKSDGQSLALSIITDLREGAKRHFLWTALAWGDLRRRYRGSKLGLFWITASLGIFVLTLGGLYGQLMRVPAERYIPYLAAGMLVWNFLSGSILESGHIFNRAAPFVKEMALPYSIFVYRFVYGQVLRFLFQAPVFVAVAAYLGFWPGETLVYLAPGLALLLLNSLWITFVMAVVSTRFRDVPELVNSSMRLVFFLTPIIWLPEISGKAQFVVDWNPFTHIIAVVRAPLMGEAPTALNWFVSAAIPIAGLPFALWLFGHCRRLIPFWVV